MDTLNQSILVAGHTTPAVTVGSVTCNVDHFREKSSDLFVSQEPYIM